MNPFLLLLASFVTQPGDVPIHPGAEALVEDPEFVTAELGDTLRLGWNAVANGDATQANVAVWRLDLIDWLKATALRDMAGRIELRREGKVVQVPYGVPCLVLELQAVEIPKRPRPASIACVRILEGDRRGEKVWVQTFEVKRMIPKTKTPRR